MIITIDQDQLDRPPKKAEQSQGTGLVHLQYQPVVVTGGHHRIVMRFRPPSIAIGLVLSGAGFALTLALLFL